MVNFNFLLISTFKPSTHDMRRWKSARFDATARKTFVWHSCTLTNNDQQIKNSTQMYYVLLILSLLLLYFGLSHSLSFSICLNDIDSMGAVLLTSPLLNISAAVWACRGAGGVFWFPVFITHHTHHWECSAIHLIPHKLLSSNSQLTQRTVTPYSAWCVVVCVILRHESSLIFDS